MRSDAFLDDVIRKFGNLRDRAEIVLRDLDEDQLNCPIEGFHWTLAQVIEHILLSHGAYIAIIEEGLLDHPPMRDAAELRLSVVGKQIAKFAGPDGHAPVPAGMKPSLTRRYPLEIRTELLDQTEALTELARKSIGVDISAIRVRNPIVPLLRLNLADCFNIPERHLEHHIRQLEKYAPTVLTA